MAFKGGTCLRKIYIKDYRFSDDLDFTLLDDISLDDLKKKIRNSIEAARDESGIDFLDEIRSEEVENGFVFLTYFRLLRTTGDPLKIKIDITNKDKEKIVNDVLNKKIKHDYSDKIDKKTSVYFFQTLPLPENHVCRQERHDNTIV